MAVNLHNDPIWNQLDDLSRRVNPETLALALLCECENKIRGYWHGNEHYEEIYFTYPLRAELESISVKNRNSVPHHFRSVKMSFLLFGQPVPSQTQLTDEDDDEIGELTLVFNSQMEFIDENWMIDVESPFLIAKRAQK
jgi:hypothetical protein